MTSAKSVAKVAPVEPELVVKFSGTTTGRIITTTPSTTGITITLPPVSMPVWTEPEPWNMRIAHHITVVASLGAEAGKRTLEEYILRNHNCSLATLRSLGVEFKYTMGKDGSLCFITYEIDPTTQAILDHGNADF